MKPLDLILEILSFPRDAIFPAAHRLLAEAHPGRHLLESESNLFDVLAFAAAGGCRAEPMPDFAGQWDVWWDARHEVVVERPFNIWPR